MTQDRRVWRATIDEWLTRAMASPGPRAYFKEIYGLHMSGI